MFIGDWMEINVLKGHDQMLGANGVKALFDIKIENVRLLALEIKVVVYSWDGDKEWSKLDELRDSQLNGDVILWVTGIDSGPVVWHEGPLPVGGCVKTWLWGPIIPLGNPHITVDVSDLPGTMVLVIDPIEMEHLQCGPDPDIVAAVGNVGINWIRIQGGHVQALVQFSVNDVSDASSVVMDLRYLMLARDQIINVTQRRIVEASQLIFKIVPFLQG